MEIILLRDMENVGFKHDLVEVKNGYGRNYLIPQGLAVIANKSNREKLEKILAEEEAKDAAKREEYKELAENLNGKVVKIGVKSGTSGKIFGSVNEHQVAAAIQEQLGIEIERKKISLPEALNEIGTYPIQIHLLKNEVVAELEIELVAE